MIYYFSFFFEAIFHYVGQAGLELVLLHPVQLLSGRIPGICDHVCIATVVSRYPLRVLGAGVSAQLHSSGESWRGVTIPILSA